MRPRLGLALVLFAFGCGSAPTGGGGADLARGARDGGVDLGGGNADLSSADMTSGADLASGPDMTGGADLALGPDLACTSLCNAGDTSCAADGTVVACVVTGGCGAFPSGGGTICAGNQACIASGTSAACTCLADVRCASGAGTYCTVDVANGNAPATYTCAPDGSGCVVAGDTLSDCGARQSCSGNADSAACTCNSDASCANGAGTYCTTDAANGNAPATYTCGTDGNGCVFAGATLSDCGTHQSCSGNAGSGACSCNSDASCSLGAGTFCTASNSYVTCASDGNSCVFASGTTTCNGSQVCGDASGAGTAACSCPAIGSAVGSGCSNPGDQTCGGGDVLTCQVSGGCNLWVDTLACSSVSLSCTSSSNTASCTCPNSGPTFFADPNATPIVLGGTTIAANGAMSPSGCRYASIGVGLTAAAARAVTTSSANVELIGSGGVITGESWPLVIPANVALFSDDTGATPTKFTLSPPAGTQAAIVQGGGTLQLVAIAANLTGASSPAAVSVANCKAGDDAPFLYTLAISFSGTATGDGVNVADPGAGEVGCSPRIENVSITNAYNGVSISTASGAASSSIGATITGSTISGSLNDGLLVYQTGTGGVSMSTSTIAGSHVKNVAFDTSTLAAHTGTVSITGTYGTTTIDNTHGSAYGIYVNNSASGQVVGGAVLNLTDVTVTGIVNVGGNYSNDSLNLTDATASLNGYVSVDSGASRGLFAVGSSVTMADDGSGNHCSISGSADGNAGMRIDSGTTLTATNLTVSGNSTSGANVTNGNSGAGPTKTTVTLNNCSFTGNLASHGITMSGHDANNTVAVTIAGGHYDGNTQAGVHVGSFATANLSGAFTASNNTGEGLLVDSANAGLTIGTPGTGPAIDNNGGDGIAQSSGTVNVNGSSSGPVYVDISNNGGNGIDFTGGSFASNWLSVTKNKGNGARVINPASGNFKLQNSNVVDHTASGVLVNNISTVSQAVQLNAVNVSNPDLTPGAGSFGVEIDQSALAGASGSYTTLLENCVVESSNAGLGIGNGSGNALAVQVLGCFFDSNLGAGLIYSTSALSNVLSISANELIANGSSTIGSGSVGGVGFAGPPPASIFFDENVIGGNGANQVYVYYAGSGSVSYDLHSSAGNEYAECTTDSYAVFGECVTAGATLAIDCDRVLWMSPTFPGQNTASSGAGTVTFSTNNAGSAGSCPTPSP